MLKRCLWLSALIAGWLMITACSSAHNTTPRYVPPGERTPLTADHQWPKNSFLVLGYHDVEDGAADQRYLSVRTSALSDQMAWLRDNGYQPISVQQILDAHDGKNCTAGKSGITHL